MRIGRNPALAAWAKGFKAGLEDLTAVDVRERLVCAIDELDEGGEPSVARVLLCGLLEDLDRLADGRRQA